MITKTYGSSTAAAVLDFKRRRQIINLSYQTQADNVVGKMTIAALDKEMLALESRRTPSVHCGDPIGGGGRITAQGAPSIVAPPPRGLGVRAPAFPQHRLTSLQVGAPSVSKVFPANLDILWQITSGAAARGGHKHLALLVKAISLLKPFRLDIISSVSSGDPPFPNEDSVDARFRQDAFKVRKASERVRPGLPTVLRIIVCPFEPLSPEFGITEGGTLDGISFPAFVLINVNKFRTDQCTAIHEMIHATGLFVHDDDATLGESVFSTASNRSILRPEHAERLSKAFFAKRK